MSVLWSLSRKARILWIFVECCRCLEAFILCLSSKPNAATLSVHAHDLSWTGLAPTTTFAGSSGGLGSSSYPSNLAASLNLAGLSLPSPSNNPFASSSSLITGLDLSTHNLHNPMGPTDQLLIDANNITPGQSVHNGIGVAGLRGATASLPNLGILNSLEQALTPGSSGLLSGMSLPAGASDYLSSLTNSLTNTGFPNLNHLPTIITTNFDKDGIYFASNVLYFLSFCRWLCSVLLCKFIM